MGLFFKTAVVAGVVSVIVSLIIFAHSSIYFEERGTLAFIFLSLGTVTLLLAGFVKDK